MGGHPSEDDKIDMGHADCHICEAARLADELLERAQMEDKDFQELKRKFGDITDEEKNKLLDDIDRARTKKEVLKKFYSMREFTGSEKSSDPYLHGDPIVPGGVRDLKYGPRSVPEPMPKPFKSEWQQARQWLDDTLKEYCGMPSTSDAGEITTPTGIYDNIHNREKLIDQIVNKLGDFLRPVIERDLRGSMIYTHQAKEQQDELRAEFKKREDILREDFQNLHGDRWDRLQAQTAKAQVRAMYRGVEAYARDLRCSLEDVRNTFEDDDLSEGFATAINHMIFLLSLSEMQYKRMKEEQR